jgi:hypothetical protein
MRARLYAVTLCLLVLSASAFAQRVALAADIGYETTQFGNPGTSPGYAYSKRSSEFVGFAPQLILVGDTGREGGWHLTVGGDIVFPFDYSDATGVPIEFAGNMMLNARLGSFGFGGGVEGREFLLPNEPNFQRPSQFLFGTPFMVKYTFGPGHRAYVQGGATLWFTNYSQNVVSAFGQTVSLTNSNITMGNCSTQSCGDIKVNGGYVFGHTALKAGYLFREMHFNLSNNSGFDPAIMDFRQNQFFGGVVLTY